MEVTIFTTKTCAYCGMVKKWLANKGIAFSEVNLTDHPERQEEAFKLSGALTVPITLIQNHDSSSVVVGLNLASLARAIAD
jgi:glutaredoxin